MFIITGDPFRFSDVGKFCLRITSSSTNEKFFYFNSDFYRKAIKSINSSEKKYFSHNITNVTNNRWLFSNFLLFNEFKKKSHGDNYVIVHEPIIEYPAKILSDHLQNENCKIPPEFSHETLKKFANDFIPESIRLLFIGLEYEERGRFLCAILLGKADIVICHSTYSKYLCEKICRDYLSSPAKIVQIPLAYDMPSADCKNTIANKKNAECISLGIFGMFFNVSKNISLLIETIKQISESHEIHLWLAGHMDEQSISYIFHNLNILNNVKVESYGFVSDIKLSNLLYSTDFVWCFRNPTHGETSGTVLRALSCGAIPIVADHGWYSEIEDHLVVKAPITASGETLACKIINLDRSKTGRKERIDYIKHVHSPKIYGETLASNNKYKYTDVDLFTPASIDKVVRLLPSAFHWSYISCKDYSPLHRLNSFSNVTSYFLSEHPMALELLKNYYENPIISISSNAMTNKRNTSSSYEFIFNVFKHNIIQKNFSNNLDCSALNPNLSIFIKQDNFSVGSVCNQINTLLSRIIYDIYSLKLNNEDRDHFLIFAYDMITIECYHVIQSISISIDGQNKQKYFINFIKYLDISFQYIMLNEVEASDIKFLRNFSRHTLDFLNMLASILFP